MAVRSPVTVRMAFIPRALALETNWLYLLIWSARVAPRSWVQVAKERTVLAPESCRSCQVLAVSLGSPGRVPGADTYGSPLLERKDTFTPGDAAWAAAAG